MSKQLATCVYEDASKLAELAEIAKGMGIEIVTPSHSEKLKLD